MEKFLNINELSELLKISKGTLYWYVHIGYIPHYKINRLVRFKEKEIIEWLSKKKCNGRRERIPEIELGKFEKLNS